MTLPMNPIAAGAYSEAGALQMGLFGEIRPPVVVAWGAGVDSTAMLIEMIARGEHIDLVLFADTGSEKPATYAFVDFFRQWLADHGVRMEVVRYEAKNFKNWPPYRSLHENVLTNATLPSISLGGGSCSIKWKQQPQHAFLKQWAPATECWAAGGKVVKLIGYDCSPADNRRFAAQDGKDDPHYVYRFPLREWGWTRAECEARIRAAGITVPPKSACFMCGATKPHEMHDLPVGQLRLIVLIEARAEPRLRNCDGLWRKPVQGCRGATPRPGSMTQYIREQNLLPSEEIDEIRACAPAALTRFQEAAAEKPVGERPALAEWVRLFELRDRGIFDVEGTQPLYRSAA